MQLMARMCLLSVREERIARISLLTHCRRSQQWMGRSGRFLSIALQDTVRRVAPCSHAHLRMKAGVEDVLEVTKCRR